MTAFGPDALPGTYGTQNDGIVSSTGQPWTNPNGNCIRDGLGHLIRDPTKPAGGSTGGCYNYIHLDAPVTQMSANLSWRGQSTALVGSQNTSLVLAYSEADTHGGTAPNLQFFQDFPHIVVNPWSLSVNVYSTGVADPASSHFFAYPAGRLEDPTGVAAMTGVEFPFTVQRRNGILTLIGPDTDPATGQLTVRRIADRLNRFLTFAGPYLGWQCYDTTDPPTYDGSHNVVSGLECRLGSPAASANPFADTVWPWPIPAQLGAELGY